jgi:hypothetical protein
MNQLKKQKREIQKLNAKIKQLQFILSNLNGTASPDTSGYLEMTIKFLRTKPTFFNFIKYRRAFKAYHA